MTDETGPEVAVKGVAEDVKGKAKEAVGAVIGERITQIRRPCPAGQRRPQSARSRPRRPRLRTPAQRQPPPRRTNEPINRQIPGSPLEPPPIGWPVQYAGAEFLSAEAESSVRSGGAVLDRSFGHLIELV